MKMKILVVAAVFACLGGTISYSLWRGQSTTKKRNQRVTSTSSGSSDISTKQPTSALTTQGQALGLGTTDGSSAGSSLQTNLGGPSSGASTTIAARSMPSPDTFGQYDQYKKASNGLFADIQIGTGAEAKAGSKVAVVYKGWLTNGTLFDESKVDPQSGKLQAFGFTLGAGQVITGWEQTVPGMKVGGTRMLIIPPAAGYGAIGHDPVPGDAVMVFEVQLVAVQ